jgi:hypothetical protein
MPTISPTLVQDKILSNLPSLSVRNTIAPTNILQPIPTYVMTTSPSMLTDNIQLSNPSGSPTYIMAPTNMKSIPNPIVQLTSFPNTLVTASTNAAKSTTDTLPPNIIAAIVVPILSIFVVALGGGVLYFYRNSFTDNISTTQTQLQLQPQPHMKFSNPSQKLVFDNIYEVNDTVQGN